MAKLTASPSSPAAPVKVTSLSFMGLNRSVFLSFSVIFLSAIFAPSGKAFSGLVVSDDPHSLTQSIFKGSP